MSAKTSANTEPPAPPPERAPDLVLASTSRYRRELLERLGLPFRVARPDADEIPLPGERPGDTALRLARAKAESVRERHPGALIIGSDQVADCDGEPVGKPGSRAEAAAMLARLAGRTIVFHTGVALLDARTGACRSAVVTARSTFRPLSAPEIAAYVEREPALDCAGAVKAEALGIVLFRAIESDDPTALIGLPLIRLVDLLEASGVKPLLAARASPSTE